jgi:CDP-glycerol glycerophosphotransferase (TagB/SpsB family)/glycosyltransferase involved in cell wall biosynthesis
MKLSISMMVKNESKYLRKCLESLKPIRDAIESELIIVDTGSTDNTVEIAKEFTDKVYFHEWNSDFSEMRNITIKYCTGEWCLVIDGDEVISNPEGILQFFSSDEFKKHNTASFSIKNFTSNDSEANFAVFTAPRIFKKDKEFRFEGAVHNQVIWKKPMIVLNSEISHYGYINNDKELMAKKFLRTTEILKSELKKNPENIYYIYQLAVSYAMHNDYPEALESIEKAYNLVKSKKLDLSKYMSISTFLAKMYLTNGKFRETEVICLEAIGKEGFYIDLYYYLAKAQCSIYKNGEAIEAYNIYFKKLEDYNNFKVTEDLSIINYTLGSYEDACLDMATLHERMGKYEDALKYIERIKSDNVLNVAFKLSISLYTKLNKFEELRRFYNEIATNHNIIKNYFISELELHLLKANKKTKSNVFKVFSEGNTEYDLLNKIRLSSGNVNNELNKEIGNLDFSNLPDYFSDILYCFLCESVSLAKYLEGVNDFKIKNYCNYLVICHGNFGINLYNYLNNYKNSELSLNEIRIYKILAVYLFQDKGIDKEKYSQILEKYLEIGEQYLSKIYHDDIIQSEKTHFMKDEEDLFLMYMHLANKNKNSEAIYIKYLRKALSSCNYMKTAIEILSERVKADLKQKDNEMELYKIKVKRDITELIEGSCLQEASILIDEYEDIIKDDFEIYSMKAVVAIMENRLVDSKDILMTALDKFNDNFDLNYNLGYVYEQMNDYNRALTCYKFAEQNCDDMNFKMEIKQTITRITNEYAGQIKPDKKRMIFFVKQGLDSFLGDIISALSDEYETKKIIVNDLKQIDDGMKWADICWFEWCDELVAYGSKLALSISKKIICRIHGYEVYTDYIKLIDWRNVDDLIIVAPHIRRLFEENTANIDLADLRVHTIFCGINVEKYPLSIRDKGFNLGYLGYINSKKNIPLTLDIFKKLHDKDSRYKLNLAGTFQDNRIFSYIKYFIKEYKLDDSIFFEEWKNEEQKIEWFKRIDYMIISSIDEGLCFAAAEAMCSGIKPILHNCEGIQDHYDKKYIFSNLDEAVEMISSCEYSSDEYRKFIEENYSIEKQMKSIKKVFEEAFKKNITLIYRNFSGSNTVALFKNIPKTIKEKYRIQCIKEENTQNYYNNLIKSDAVVTTHGNYMVNKSLISTNKVIIDLWHGFPLKAMGYEDKGEKNKQDISKIWNNYNYAVSYSELYSELMSKCAGINAEKFKIMGAPRNDLLFSSEGRSNIEKLILKKLKNKKVIFYMPTFRSTPYNRQDGAKEWDSNIFGMKQFNQQKFEKFLQQNSLIIILKVHPNEEKKVLQKYKNSRNIVVLPSESLEKEHSELYEILNAADILITDYSSVYFDYLLLDRPIIFTPIDLEEYDSGRGFLLEPYDKWTPGPKVIDQTNLELEILKCLRDKEYFKCERFEIAKVVHEFQDANSSKRVWKLIDDLLD